MSAMQLSGFVSSQKEVSSHWSSRCCLLGGVVENDERDAMEPDYEREGTESCRELRKEHSENAFMGSPTLLTTSPRMSMTKVNAMKKPARSVSKASATRAKPNGEDAWWNLIRNNAVDGNLSPDLARHFDFGYKTTPDKNCRGDSQAAYSNEVHAF